MSSNPCNSNCAVVKNWCLTETHFYKTDFQWTISNFDFHEKKETELISSEFSASGNDKFKWYLKCKPNGVSENKDGISVYLKLKFPADFLGSVFTKFSLIVLDSNQKTVKGILSNVCEFNAGNSCWGYDDFFKKDANFRNKLSSNNNRLVIRCTVEFSQMDNVVNNFHQCKPAISPCKLSEDLKLIFENQQFSDVILSVKGKNYNVHKTILVARSPVFAAMFSHNTIETEQNRVVIEDVDESVMDEMLRYLYTGKCQNLNKFPEGILAAADKYGLDCLKVMCVEELCKTLSVKNAANLLVLADLHGVEELKIEVIKFIVAKFTEVKSTTDWENVILSHPRLVGEVCEALARRCNS